MTQVYFLCTGNSCRSQMAEGFAHKYLSGWTIASAGVEQHGLNPRADKAMAEAGVDISGQTSDLIDLDYFNSSDLIITLCGDARDKCPMIPAGIKHVHWDLEDPAKATGTEEEVFEAFRETRDKIEAEIRKLA
ncbi:arsenate reductase (thioredoxin) [Lactococcus termiticola]|uniref:Arsenate reductase n=1 Tax=Lactococcus termiticola TaxID=2169526 RepID=A0A2R5HG19_9LACT|nr:arsenate reductase (thioredoxin) [Lactococcus termiticola]GBG97007.1 arsenate reductase [Lactococcus termiticola]